MSNSSSMQGYSHAVRGIGKLTFGWPRARSAMGIDDPLHHRRVIRKGLRRKICVLPGLIVMAHAHHIALAVLHHGGVLVHEIELPNPDQSLRKVSVLSIATLAEKLGLPAEELVRRISLLGAVRRKVDAADPVAPEALLEKWLDSYHVRGSFDDRTLIVMHRQELP